MSISSLNLLDTSNQTGAATGQIGQSAGGVPPALEGAMYYDPTTGKLQTYTNGAWADYNGNAGTGVLGANTSTSNVSNAPQYNSQQQAYRNYQPTALNNIGMGATDSFNSGRNALQGGAQNLFDSIRGSQQTLDTSRANNELNRTNSINDILGYVRSGVQSGGSRLASMNALDSSATGALSRAYNQIGSQKVRGVNNQAGLVNNQLDNSQTTLTQQQTSGLDNLKRQKDDIATTIGNDVRSKLTELDNQAVGLSLPDRIAIDQEKQKIIDAGMAKLNEVDQWLQGQLGTVHPLDQQGVIDRANELRQSGSGLSNPFATNGASQQIQGAPLDQLPLFTSRKRQQ